ncbi:MAG: hypothetical protein PHF73_10380, partial [Massilibacteroides sp.]|nr:hypothetical protein [Massilibacteroides sp.]
MERNRELAEIRATYDHEKLIGEKNQLILEKKRVQTLWLIVLITCITLCGTTLLLYQRKIIRKIRIIQGARKHLRELTEQIAVNELTVLSNENFIQTIGGQLKQQIELEEHVREQQGDIERIREANTQLLRRNEQLEIEVTKYTSLAQSAGMEQLELDRLLEEIQILQQKENYFLDMLIHRLQMIGSLKEDPRPVTSEEGEQLMEEMES